MDRLKFDLSSKKIKYIYSIVERWNVRLFEPSFGSKNQKKNIEYIQQGYQKINLAPPPILFVKSPARAILSLKQLDINISCSNYLQLVSKLSKIAIKNQIKFELFTDCEAIINTINRATDKSERIVSFIYNWIQSQFTDSMLHKLMEGDISSINYCRSEYYIDKLKLKHDDRAWNSLKNLIRESPFLIPLSEVCIVIERPVEVHLNNELIPHAWNKPAIKFADGFAIYCHHGIPFPAKYGKIPIERWKPKWILSETEDEYRSVLIYTIGYKRFRRDYPKYDFWQERNRLLYESVEIAINWQLYHHHQLYLKHQPIDLLRINPYDTKQIINNLPFKLPIELYDLYWHYNGGYELAPDLYFYPLKQAIAALPNLNWLESSTGYPFPLFKGSQGEIYYVIASKVETTYSHVYCQFPHQKEAIIYAECVTSLIVTIAQCYQEGAYYTCINEKSEKSEIKRDLNKEELIFDKFNPDRIDNWRKIWRNESSIKTNQR